MQSYLLPYVVGFLSLLSPLYAEKAEGKRLEVLFLGDDRGHKPIERYRVLKQALGPKGVNLTFVEDLSLITRERLDQYDALVVYANHEKDEVPVEIKPWVEEGGALVALHSACGCFHPSPDWFALVGGRFASHEGREVTPKTVDADHEITKGLPVLTSWDETYVHQMLTQDRHLLQVREPSNKGETQPEPWTWTRHQGKGRVFYTASGHDLRCWTQPAYQELVLRGIVWAADERAQDWKALKLPELQTLEPELQNRAHPEVPMLPLQKPLSPSESAKHVQVPVGTRLELFAAEPLVFNPIALDWDLRGRAWVVEAMDYPNDISPDGKGHDRIVILEDTDHDGKADKRTVFADHMSISTTLLFSRGGVIATDGESIVFLKDENGDGVSDSRQVMATGFKIWDTHACTSHFRQGIDNWIYATVGYSGIDTEIHGKRYKSSAGLFRFRPDFSAFELLQNTTNNTWGLDFTEEEDVMGSTANKNPSWSMSIPARYYEAAGMKQPKTPRADQTQTIYPITGDFTQVDQIDCYTAGAGHDFYHDEFSIDGVGKNDVMISEPTAHLVGLGRVRGSGSQFATDFRGNNLYASADAWSAPVAARTGPDGAIWIADWYNPIVQHNVVVRFYNPGRGYDRPHSPYHTGDSKPGRGNAYATPLRDREHGRIWRIVPRSDLREKLPSLDPAKPESLIAALSHPARATRITAQRLLIERGKKDVEPQLISLLAGKNTTAALHALWSLEGLGALKEEGEALQAARARLDSASPLLIRHVLLALGGKDAGVAKALPRLMSSSRSPRERLFILLSAAEAAPTEAQGKGVLQLMQTEGAKADDSLKDALRIAARAQAKFFLPAAYAAVDFDATDAAVKWVNDEVVAVTAYASERAESKVLADQAPEAILTRAAELLAKRDAVRKQEQFPKHLEPGKQIYQKACIECHQADGKGVAGTFPPLAGSEWVKGDRTTFLRIVLGGIMGKIQVAGTEYNSAMPGHSHMSNEELASVTSYVRFQFGGLKESAIEPKDIESQRPVIKARQLVPWTVDELKAAK